MRALNTENIPAQVRSGYVDLSFHAIVAQEKWPGLRVIPYMEDPLVAICSQNHRFAANKSVRLETLSQESFVDLTPERALRKVVDQGLLCIISDERQCSRSVMYRPRFSS